MTLDALHQLISDSYRAEDRAPVWKWGADNLRLRESPLGKTFKVDETPWLKEPLEVLPDNRIKEIVLVCCAQGGKTTSLQVGSCWALAQAPGPVMQVLQTEDAAKKFARQRMLPMLLSCDALRSQMSEDRHESTIREVLLANATLMIGPANESFLRAHSIRWLFCDEVSDWKPGLLEQARARTTRYWNRRHWISSTPLDAGSDLERAWLAGDQREWCLRCLGCNQLILPEFRKVIRWDTNDTTKPGGEWNFDAVRLSVRLVCPHCGHQHQHTDAAARAMNARGAYVRTNTSAPAHLTSFRFNALCLPPSVLSWADLVEQFLRAKADENKGYLQPLKEFVTLRLAEFWDESKLHSVESIDVGAYNPESDWPEERFRFLTVDCQKDLIDFWAVVRAWAQDGSSRLIAFERLRSFAEVEDFRARHGVPHKWVFVDAGYKQQEVHDHCSLHDWHTFKGDDGLTFLHEDGARRPYSMPTFHVAANGKAVMWKWSALTIKDLLHNLKSGRGASWQICDLGQQNHEYGKQLNSERKAEVGRVRGKPVVRWVDFRSNHAWDCECMQVVAACMAGLFG